MLSLDRQLQKSIGTLFPILGAGLLAGALVATVLTDRFIQGAFRGTGTVVRLNAGGAHPVVQFIPEGRAAVEFATSGWINYRVGDRVSVLYRMDQSPMGFQARIDTPGDLYSFPSLLTGLGVGFILGGYFTKREALKPNGNDS
jgi:hypothetical protein